MRTKPNRYKILTNGEGNANPSHQTRQCSICCTEADGIHCRSLWPRNNRNKITEPVSKNGSIRPDLSFHRDRVIICKTLVKRIRFQHFFSLHRYIDREEEIVKHMPLLLHVPGGATLLSCRGRAQLDGWVTLCLTLAVIRCACWLIFSMSLDTPWSCLCAQGCV